MFTDEQKQEIIKKLQLKGLSNVKCPMCGKNDFVISDGYSTITIQDEINVFKLGGKSIPFITIVCVNCGFISHHAIGMLGLLPKKEADIKDENLNEARTSTSK